jgi:hypothetical protein
MNIRAVCMLCSKSGIRAEMHLFGNGLVCDDCNGAIGAARKLPRAPVIEPFAGRVAFQRRKRERQWTLFLIIVLSLAVGWALGFLVCLGIRSGD